MASSLSLHLLVLFSFADIIKLIVLVGFCFQ